MESRYEEVRKTKSSRQQQRSPLLIRPIKPELIAWAGAIRPFLYSFMRDLIQLMTREGGFVKLEVFVML